MSVLAAWEVEGSEFTVECEVVRGGAMSCELEGGEVEMAVAKEVVAVV